MREKKNVSIEERIKELFERDQIRVGEKVTYTSQFIEMRFRTIDVWLDKAHKKGIVGIIIGILALIFSVISIIWR